MICRNEFMYLSVINKDTKASWSTTPSALYELESEFLDTQ